METKNVSSSRHKEWRRLAKKERRKRVRRKAAQERDADDERLRATLERSANYTNWLAEQEKEENNRKALEQREHAEKEQLWLEEEVRAQKEWRAHQERKAKARQEKVLQEEIIRNEFEAKQEILRKKREENKRLYEAEIKKQEDIKKEIDEYIDNGSKTPETLRLVTESQSGKELCPFFTKTGACRYGDICSRNHRRVALSKVILVPSFYSHFSLEKNSAEYDTDISLEFERSEMRKDFREFYNEVVPELENFGRIKTLKYCCNTEIHLRGNLYVEYRSEREAARARRKLNGRYWAGRQLNCEFVNLNSWRDAVCGMTKCPKGRTCNFLHTFRNPNDEYDVKSPPRWTKKKEPHDGNSSRRSEKRSSTSKWDEFDRASTEESRNWRWSESPEPGLSIRTRSDVRSRRSTEDRSDRRHRSERRRGSESERSCSRNSTSEPYHHRRKSSSVRSSRREDTNNSENESKNEQHLSSKKTVKKSKKRRKEHEIEDNEEATNVDIKISKKSKSSDDVGTNRKIETNRDEIKSRSRLITKDKKDENIDNNSKKSGTTVKSLKSEDKSIIGKVSNPRWDKVQQGLSPEEDVRLTKQNSESAENEETDKEPLMITKILCTDENAWETTDSESEEK